MNVGNERLNCESHIVLKTCQFTIMTKTGIIMDYVLSKFFAQKISRAHMDFIKEESLYEEKVR